MKNLLSIVSLLVLLGVAVGCSGLSTVVVTATSAPAEGSTPVVSTPAPITGTSVSSSGSVVGGLPSGSVTPGMGGTPTPITADSSGNPTVTLANNGGTVLMQVGQRFLLNLGEMYDWNVTLDDQNIVSRVVNITTIRGSQGLYEAHASGTTLMRATGDPVCRQSTPPCEMPSIQFLIQITVQ